MIKAFTTTTALTLALVLAIPGHAQHIGGGLGGGFGGGLGGFGGGLSAGGLPVRGLGGDLGATGSVTNMATNATAHANVRTPKPPKVPKTPNLPNPNLAGPTKLVQNVEGRATTTTTGVTNRLATTTGTLRQGVERTGGTLERDVTRIAVVPAIPDYAARRVAIYDAGIAPIGYDDAPAYIDNQYQVFQNDLRGTGVEVVRHGQQIVLEMPSDVTFAFNKHDIQPRFQPVLDAVAHTLSKYPATYIDVDGHTDAVGSQAYNQVLSEQRADTVASYLSDRSVVPARLHVAGFGKTEPIASNATIMGRAANRRVEIVLTPYVN